MIGKLIYLDWKAGLGTLTIAAIVGAGFSGSGDVIKPANDLGKAVVQALAAAGSSTGTTSVPGIINAITGSIYRVVSPDKFRSDGLVFETTGLGTLFFRST